MASEVEPRERAYPYWPGWYSAGCSAAFFGIMGAGGVSLIPYGWDKVLANQLPTGVALLVFGVLGIPTLLMGLLFLLRAARDTFHPPLLRVTTTGIVLPLAARGEPPEDEHGLPAASGPPQPEQIPFAAITSVKRHGPRFNEVIEVAHSFSKEPLQINQPMMTAQDFNDLEAALRAILPGAFAPNPSVESGGGA